MDGLLTIGWKEVSLYCGVEAIIFLRTSELHVPLTYLVSFSYLNAGLLRDMFTNKITTKEHWDMLTDPGKLRIQSGASFLNPNPSTN